MSIKWWLVLEVFLLRNRNSCFHTRQEIIHAVLDQAWLKSLTAIPWISHTNWSHSKSRWHEPLAKGWWKNLGMRWTWKQEAEKDALLHLQAAALHLWLQPELYQFNCNNFNTKSIQRFGHMITVTDISFGHAVCLVSLTSINQFFFLLLWAIQSKNHTMCGLGMCRISIHPAKQTPRFEPSLLSH